MCTAGAVEMKPTTFLDLPAELRNAIYLDVLSTIPKGIITLRAGDLNDDHKAHRTSHCHLSLLCTTKQIHTETLPIFLSNHRIHITKTAWPRAFTTDCCLTNITHLGIDKRTSSSITTTLTRASALPSLTTLDIRFHNFRFAKVKPYLEKGFPVLRKLCISDPKLETLMEHLALEEVWNGEEMVMPSSCVYSVKDFQTWRARWDMLVSLKTVDQELETETRERMTGVVATRLF